MTKRLGSW